MASYGSIESSHATPSGKDATIDETEPLIDHRSILSKPNVKEGLWSRLTFQWFSALLYIGNRNNRLDQTDLDLIPLPDDLETKEIMASFDKYWQEELQKERPSLVIALAKAFGFEYFVAALLKLVHDLSVFVGPQVLHAMIDFLRDPQASVWQGLGLTLAVTVSQIAMSFCLRHYFFMVSITYSNISLLL